MHGACIATYLRACGFLKTKFRVSKSGPNVILFTPLRERERESVRCEERIDREMNWQQKLEQMKRIIVKYHPYLCTSKTGRWIKKKKKEDERQTSRENFETSVAYLEEKARAIESKSNKRRC